MNPFDDEDAANEAMRRVGCLLLLWGQLETRIAYGIHLLTPAAEQNKMSYDLPRLADELARLDTFIVRIRDLDYSV